jgi:hypothetical protein
MALLQESLVVNAVPADPRSLVVGASILPNLPNLPNLPIPRRRRATNRGASVCFPPAHRLFVSAR